MDVIRKKPDWKSRLTSWGPGEGSQNGPTASGPAPGGPTLALSGMDRVVKKTPLWKRFWIPAALVVAAGAGAFWALSGPGGSVYRVPVDQLTIGTVTKGPFEDFIAVRGSVAPLIIDYLTTAQGGSVKEVLVEDGAKVKKGQPLIVLSNPALQLEVAAQQLAFEQTRFKYEHDIMDIDHQINTLKNTLAVDKVLLDGQAIAPNVYKQVQDDYAYNVKLRAAMIASEETEQRVRASQMSGGGTTTNPLNGDAVANAGVEALTIRAPMDGQLSALDAEVGETKAVGAVLGQVNSADRFKLTADVDEFYLGKVNMGQEALFTIDGENFKAQVAKVYPQVTNGTFKVDFHFDGKAPTGIHVGQAVDMRVELGGASEAVMLPNGPFYQDTGGNWVFVVVPGGQSAMKRNVKLGRRNPQFVEVVDGLSPGEKVIVSGYEAYQKMDRVEFEKASSGG